MKVVRVHETTMKTHKTEMKRIETELFNVQRQLTDGKNKLNELNTDVKLKVDQRKKITAEVKQLVGLGEKLGKKINDMVGSTQKERVDSNKSEDELKKLIEAGLRQISRIQMSNDNFEEVETLLNDKKAHMRKIKGIYTGFMTSYARVNFKSCSFYCSHH